MTEARRLYEVLWREILELKRRLSGGVGVVTSVANLINFPGGTTTFLRADGTFATPSGSSYTDEEAQDAVGAMLADTATIDLTYTDATPELKADVIDDSIDNAKLANMADGTAKGRAAGAGTGDPQDLTPDQLSTLLDSATDPFVRTSAAGGSSTDYVVMSDGVTPTPSPVDDGYGNFIFVLYTP